MVMKQRLVYRVGASCFQKIDRKLKIKVIAWALMKLEGRIYKLQADKTNSAADVGNAMAGVRWSIDSLTTT